MEVITMSITRGILFLSFFAFGYIFPQIPHNGGLANIGNTCYMNAAVQCLSNQERFREILIQNQNRYKDKSISRHYIDLIQEMRIRKVITPKVFAQQALPKFFTDCNEQQDSAAFLQKLLGDHLCDKTDLASNLQVDAQEDKDYLASLLNIISTGCNTTTYCPSCKTETPQITNENILTVEVLQQERVSLGDCLKQHFETETLSNDNKYYCPDCKKDVNAQRKISLSRLPTHLIIVLKIPSLGNSKRDFPVSIPLSRLEMRPFLTPDAHENYQSKITKYNLTGVVSHSGRTFKGGHYTAYVNDFESKEWYCFDDTHCHSISKNFMTRYLEENKRRINDKTPYILFYELASKKRARPTKTKVSSQKTSHDSNSDTENKSSEVPPQKRRHVEKETLPQPISKTSYNESDYQKVINRDKNLAGANLRGAILNDVDLSGADLTGADLSHAKLDNANLADANLTDTVFFLADLTHAHLNGATLVRTKFVQTKLKRTDFSRIKLIDTIDATRASISNINFVEITIKNSKFQLASLEKVDFNQCFLKNLNMQQAQINDVTFNNTELTNINFKLASINGMKIFGTQCLDLNFENATIENSAFLGRVEKEAQALIEFLAARSANRVADTWSSRLSIIKKTLFSRNSALWLFLFTDLESRKAEVMKGCFFSKANFTNTIMRNTHWEYIIFTNTNHMISEKISSARETIFKNVAFINPAEKASSLGQKFWSDESEARLRLEGAKVNGHYHPSFSLYWKNADEKSFLDGLIEHSARTFVQREAEELVRKVPQSSCCIL